MPKTTTPATLEVGGHTFATNAVPDPFDERDLVYRPKLDPLPFEIPVKDPEGSFVLEQRTKSCTGHALAAVINAVLALSSEDSRSKSSGASGGKRRPSEPVSPYMLYWLARRYDEFQGTEDEGSSLRGALKGWFHHGVCKESSWEGDQEPDFNNEAFLDECRQHPLGAFYRVMPYRLDDMQSAISELHAVVASARVHEGWQKPIVMRRAGEECPVIARPAGATPSGGHAFAIVGYNAIGFWVQNSWGPGWGAHGYAVLPYDDWLDNAYDAWVIRPGVPSTPFSTGRTRSEEATNSILAMGKGPDLRRLDRHVVNIGDDGKLSSTGQFVSSPEQLDRIVSRMEEWHDGWLQEPRKEGDPRRLRQVVLYAHSGLTSEADLLRIADRHLNWWLNNRVYPIYFDWQSGAVKTLVDHLVGVVTPKLPAGGVGFDLLEQFDRLVEKVARESLRWIWREMKRSAALATQTIADDAPADAAAATRLVQRVAAYGHSHSTELALHLVGHGAGSIFLAALLPRLAEAGLPVSSLTFLAPALRVDEFVRDVLPSLRDSKVKWCAVFGLSDAREADDTCGIGGVTAYNKSILYLLARGVEQPGPKEHYVGEIPILGMEKFLHVKVDGDTFGEMLNRAEIDWIAAPSLKPAKSRTNAHTHAEFGDDALTMGSVMMRMLGRTEVVAYEPDLPLDGLQLGAAQRAEGASSLAMTADTNAPGSVPVEEVAAGPAHLPFIPVSHTGPEPEMGIPIDPKTQQPVQPTTPAPSPAVQNLERDGWRQVS
jgi:hypothetical protein